jgi:hypothetical protein
MNTQLDYLFSIESPWIYAGLGELERVDWLPTRFYARQNIDACVRKLRGGKMRTVQGLMNEFVAVFQLFDGFGENWIALEECLEYLDEWMPAQAYILVIERADELLAVEKPDQMVALLQTLHAVGEWWARPIVDNERFNRTAIPFHILMNGSQTDRIVIAAQDAGVPIRSWGI